MPSCHQQERCLFTWCVHIFLQCRNKVAQLTNLFLLIAKSSLSGLHKSSQYKITADAVRSRISQYIFDAKSNTNSQGFTLVTPSYTYIFVLDLWNNSFEFILMCWFLLHVWGCQFLNHST